jgi:hypothetical protein
VIFLFRKKYLIIREQEKERCTGCYKFPPQPPDLNPIENLWEHLKREKVKHNLTSKDKLTNLWDVVIVNNAGITLNHQY